MKEQGTNQTNAPGVQQPLLSLRRIDQLQPRAASFDTLPLSAIQKQDLHPGRIVAQPSKDIGQLQPQKKLTEKDTTPLTDGKPLTIQTTTEPLPLLPTDLEAAFSQVMPTRLRRSREKPAEVSLEDVPLLNSRDQYNRELLSIERLSPEEEERVVAQARTGDTEAKKALIENCLWYIMRVAKSYSVYVEHDDLLDIVQVGNLAVTEKVDQALEKAESVGAYLNGVAKQAISTYCLYHSRLMPIKDHSLPIAEFPQMTSLDALREEAGNRDILPIAEQTTQEETDQEKLRLVRQALSQLTKKQREVIAIRFGLGDTRLKRIRDIAEHLAVQPEAIENRYTRAFKRLRAFFSYE